MKQLFSLLGFIVLIVPLNLGCVSQGASINSNGLTISPSPEPTGRYGKSWQEIAFPFIEERLAGTEIESLSEISLPPNSLEIRVWAGFSLAPLRGLIINQTGSESSAIFLRPRPIDSNVPCIIKLNPPKSGWQTFWNKFDSLGIASLEDSGDIPMIDEGRGVIVEIKNGGNYRNYKYSGVSQEKGGGYATLFNFTEFISAEFGIDLLWEPMPKSGEICDE